MASKCIELIFVALVRAAASPLTQAVGVNATVRRDFGLHDPIWGNRCGPDVPGGSCAYAVDFPGAAIRPLQLR
eukprot:7038896-Prorocentrum_lima.AAC.1